jgi:hypothetical protein
VIGIIIFLVDIKKEKRKRKQTQTHRLFWNLIDIYIYIYIYNTTWASSFNDLLTKCFLKKKEERKKSGYLFFICLIELLY